MDETPSTAAWVLLVVLVSAVGTTAAWVRTRPRTRANDGADERESVENQHPRLVPRWILPAIALPAFAPAVIVTVLGATWQATIWWSAFAIPAAVVLGVVLGSAAGLVWAWVKASGHVEPDARGTVWATIALIVAAVLALTVVDAALIAGGTDVPTALVTSLLLGYLCWHGAYALMRRSYLQ